MLYCKSNQIQVSNVVFSLHMYDDVEPRAECQKSLDNVSLSLLPYTTWREQMVRN